MDARFWFRISTILEVGGNLTFERSHEQATHPRHVVETYRRVGETEFKVLVVKVVDPAQVLASGPGSIHEALGDEGVGTSIGLYFYRFADLKHRGAFTKIGEVSRSEGVRIRKHRGWLAPKSYGDSYLKAGTKGAAKFVYSDVLTATEVDPLFFVFYQFDLESAFPKIDELVAFAKHRAHFGQTTRNRESPNSNPTLGRKLVWHPSAFEEVLAMRLPSGRSYQEAIP